MAVHIAVARMEAFGRAGLTVSVCCGPAAGVFRWTVQVLSRDGQEFEAPFAADDFVHAIEIAELEVQQRGWV
jgi:hypothetical protein